MKMNERQLNTVLACLRAYQEEPDILAGMPHFADGSKPLTPRQVDKLCEDLNCEDDEPKGYTVVLLYPDYMTDDYGKETYTAWSDAKNVDAAIADAQAQAMAAQNDNSEKGSCDVCDPADFLCVVAFKGHLEHEVSANDL